MNSHAVGVLTLQILLVPSRVGTMHSDCTGVGFLSPQSSKVLINQGEIPNSEKLILEILKKFKKKNILEDTFRNEAVTKKMKNFKI